MSEADITTFKTLTGHVDFRRLADSLPSMIAFWNNDRRCEFANAAYLHWFGWSPDIMIGMHLQELLGDRVFALNEPYIQAALEGRPQTFERTLTKADGTVANTLTNYMPNADAAGIINGFFVLVTDVTILKRAETAVRILDSRVKQVRDEQFAQSKRWLELAEEIAHVGHWTISVPDLKIFWSDEIYRIHGLDKEVYTPEIDSATDMFHPDDRSKVAMHVDRAIMEKAGFEFQARLICPDGDIRYVLSRGVVQIDDDGEVIFIFGVLIDITEQKEIEQRLETTNSLVKRSNDELKIIADFDSLTGLPNRRMLDRTLAVEFRRAVRAQRPICLIMVDLDYFKGFNDVYGHPAGDDCLQQVASAIRSVLRRPSDLAARYGGEEIAIVLPNTDLAGARVVAQSIVEAVRRLGIEHRKSPERMVSVSCGVAAVEHPTEVSAQNALIERADRAVSRQECR
jgi:diguanylate cyclase (GGDEF)-like protein/PAS domain S-box-containing protein